MAKKTIVKKTRTSKKSVKNDFPFTSEIFDSISGNGAVPEYVKEYRRDAWKNFANLPIPTTKEEAWRRTNLKSMPVNDFFIPEYHKDAYIDLTPVPDEILEPLVGESHSGQIIITPQFGIIKTGSNLH